MLLIMLMMIMIFDDVRLTSTYVLDVPFDLSDWSGAIILDPSSACYKRGNIMVMSPNGED